MTRTNLNPPSENVVEQFEEECRNLGLRVHRGGLAKYEESTHWHLTIPKEKGTLEATWWPTNNTLWIEVRANRSADWMPPVIEALVKRF